MRDLVGDREARDIRQQVDRILHDLGSPEPPLKIELVIELLRLDRTYYNTTNPGFLAELRHMVKVAGKQVVARPTLLIDVIKKANLSGLWIPDSKRILVDETVPSAKHRWIEAHEISHSFIPWHKEFLFGDNEATLDPQCHATIEAEANFGASRLLFLQDSFANEAKDFEISFKSVQVLKKRYGNTLTSTFWRFIEDRDPSLPAFGMIGRHPKYPEIGKTADGSTYRYFIRSKRFREQFATVTAEVVLGLISRHASWRKSGPVLDAEDALADDTGARHIFRLQSFSNTHDLLTIGHLSKK